MQVQQITKDVLLEKYAKGNETTQEEIFRRVAKGIASVEENKHVERTFLHDEVMVTKPIHEHDYWEGIFFDNMMNGAIGAGRIMSAAGTGIAATLANCFVQPVGDSVRGKDQDGVPGIYDALSESAETMRRGGGVGYNFSLIRPKGARVGSVGSLASGPCSYMDIFDSSCKTVESAGERRGAQMGVLNINHPDIEEFIKAKRTDGRWRNFNVSVFVTDYFMHLKDTENAYFDLIHKAEPGQALKDKGAYKKDNGIWVYKSIKASELWNMIMQSNYDFAEPGVLFENNINKDNNLRYCEQISATNPCGEQPLPPYGCCDLGPIILTKFVSKPFTSEASFDFISFRKAIEIQVRFLDNVLDATMWPLEQQRVESNNKRRIGVGFTGLGNALAMLDLNYKSDDGREMAKAIALHMRDSAYRASVELGKEKGTFPLFNAEKYLEEGTFASRLPEDIKDSIRQYGIRNSHLLSIAPTGTVSLAFADNASGGIEPPFSLVYNRKKRNGDGTWAEYKVIDHALRVFLSSLAEGYRDNVLEAISTGNSKFKFENKYYPLKDLLPPCLVTAQDMTVDEHIAMLEVVQPYIDTSISKTVNVPEDFPFENFKEIYEKAWKVGLKGISTYRPNSIIGSILSVTTPEVKKEEPVAVTKVEESIDFLNNFILKRPNGTLPSKTKKVEYLSSSFVDDNFYVGVSFLKDMKRPIEVFFTVCPDGVPQEWLDSYAISLSLLARGGLDLFCKTLRALRKVKSDKGQVRYGWYEKADGSKVPRFHSSEVACMAYAIQEILIEENVITELGFPKKQELENNIKTKEVVLEVKVEETKIIPGKECSECGAHAVIKKDGCHFCTNCSHLGECG